MEMVQSSAYKDKNAYNMIAIQKHECNWEAVMIPKMNENIIAIFAMIAFGFSLPFLKHTI